MIKLVKFTCVVRPGLAANRLIRICNSYILYLLNYNKTIVTHHEISVASFTREPLVLDVVALTVQSVHFVAVQPVALKDKYN